LLAIADAAGGKWPERARAATRELSAHDAPDDGSLAIRLLTDCRRAFAESGDEKLSTARLLDLLAEDEEAPWGDWYGAPLKPRKLESLLRPFGIRSGTVRLFDDTTAKGYKVDDFADAWERYAPSTGNTSVTSVTTAPLSQESTVSNPSQDPSCDGFEEAADPQGSADVTGVTDRNGGNGGDALTGLLRSGVTSALVERVRELAEQGLGLSVIAKEVGQSEEDIWSILVDQDAPDRDDGELPE
jgi:hypothetical protein